MARGIVTQDLASLIHDPASAYSAQNRSRQIGYYLHDHIELTSKLFLTAGGRWDDVNTNGQLDSAFSPNVGVNYFVAPQLSLYVDWARPFNPQTSGIADRNGNALPPESGRSIEGGVKVGDPAGPLHGLISIFELTRRNVATSDPENPFFYVVTGEQRSRGVEVEGGWAPISAFKLSLAYAYIDAILTKDTVFTEGTRLPNVPKHNIYAYGKYGVQSGPLARLGVSAGLLYNSKKSSSLSEVDIDGDGIVDSAVPLPAYTLVDIGASYALEDWEAKLGIDNVFDRRYYPDAGYYTRITPGEPRNWRVSVSRKF